MSNKLSLDFGFNIGDIDNMDDAKNSFVKLKIGKGAEDAMILKDVIEKGIGKKLSDKDHYVCFKVPENTNLEKLIKQIESTMEGGEFPIELMTVKDGYKWMMLSLKKANEDQKLCDLLKLEEEISRFFDGVSANAFFEVFLKSSHHFSEAKTVAEKLNEQKLQTQPTFDELPSLATMYKGLSGHFKADIDHDFCTKTAEFLQKFCPITPQIFEFVKKMNNVEMALNLNSIDELYGNIRDKARSEVWHQMGNIIPVTRSIKSYLEVLDELRVIFVLKDSAYLSLEIKAPGFSDYINYVLGYDYFNECCDEESGSLL